MWRYAIAPLAGVQAFFQSVQLTGGHLASMQSVAAGDSDIAAIDAVSYQLALDAFPELQDKLRSIGLSESTSTLPLVYAAANNSFDPDACLSMLNQALDNCSAEVKNRLRLRTFLPVTLEDYDSILSIEKTAIELGYHELK